MKTIQFEKITPKIASEYLQGNKGNRPLNERKVNIYAHEMNAGNWHNTGESILFDENGKLLNGQHRLTAIIRSGCTVEMPVMRGAETEAFMYCDRGRMRTPSDIFAINGVSTAKIISGGVRAYLTFVRKRHVTHRSSHFQWLSEPSHLYELYKEHEDVFNECCKMARNFYRMSSRMMKESEVIGLSSYLMLNKIHDKETVFAFFGQLCGELATCDATALLARRLRDDICKSRPFLSDLDRRKFIVVCWNSFLRGTPIKKVQLKTIPDDIDFE